MWNSPEKHGEAWRMTPSEESQRSRRRGWWRWVVAVSGSPHIRRRNDGGTRADGMRKFLLIT